MSKSLPPETPTVGKAGNHLRLDRPCLDTSAVNSLVAFAPLSLAAWKQHPWSEILPAEEERNACEIATVKSDKVTKIIHLSKFPIVGQKKFQAKVAWFVNKNDFDKPLSPKKSTSSSEIKIEQCAAALSTAIVMPRNNYIGSESA